MPIKVTQEAQRRRIAPLCSGQMACVSLSLTSSRLSSQLGADLRQILVHIYDISRRAYMRIKAEESSQPRNSILSNRRIEWKAFAGLRVHSLPMIPVADAGGKPTWTSSNSL